jgi:hypothetical protein
MQWLAPALTAACLLISIASAPRDFLATLTNGLRFATGSFSMYDAYTHQPGLPGTSSAIHPAAQAAWNIAGRDTRIWSLHNNIYCMLPGCRLESFTSFRFSPQAGRILGGTAEEAKRILKSEHLNYFLIVTDQRIQDPLPQSALFAPENIDRHLGVVWSDGTSALLTWLEPGIAPIPLSWMEKYRSSAATRGFPPLQKILPVVKQLQEESLHRPPPWSTLQP